MRPSAPITTPEPSRSWPRVSAERASSAAVTCRPTTASIARVIASTAACCGEGAALAAARKQRSIAPATRRASDWMDMAIPSKWSRPECGKRRGAASRPKGNPMAGTRAAARGAFFNAQFFKAQFFLHNGPHHFQGNCVATYLELKEQEEKLLAEAERMREQEIADAIADIKRKIDAYGLTEADLGFARSGPAGGVGRPKSAKSPAVMKYRGPNGETWS